MKKIFTLGCGLLLMSAFAFNEAKADYLPQSTWIYLENYDEEEIADPVEVELTMNSEGEYTIPDFLNSYCPFTFTFEKPAIDETSAITITSNLSSSETSPYLLDEDGGKLSCWIKNLNGEKGWFLLYAPKIYITEDYSYVYRLDKEEYGYDYYANLCFKGTAYAENDTDYENPIELGWSILYFYFNEPEQVESPETPEFPKTIEYTINGEKELEGVDVDITDNGWGPEMTVTGESDAETITLTLALPEGWDGWIVNTLAEVSEQPNAKTRSEEDWDPMPLEFFLNNMGYQKGNTVTFVVGEDDWAQCALYKGDKVHVTSLSIEFDVVPAGSVVTTDPVYPQSVGVSTYAEGLDVEQTNEEGQITVAVTGEIEETTFDVVLDVPEGWDGFISMTQAGDVTVSDSENGVDPKNTRAEEEEGWISLEEALAAEGVQGNKFTFKANGERNHVEVYLYKGEQVYVANSITLTANVKKYINPELAAANQAAYEEVVAKIKALQKEYEAALKEAEEANPDYDFSEWKEIITGALDQALEGAEQALYSANEDGEEFQFAFDGEEFEAMIAEMKKSPIVSENNAAYNKVAAEINEVKAEYDEAVEFIKEYNPEFDLTEWAEIGKMIEETAEGAEQALYAANEDGAEFNFAFSAEDYEGMITEMKKEAVAAPNQDAYDKVVVEIDRVQEEYETSLKALEEEYPDYDMSEWEEIIGGQLNQYKGWAEQAYVSANDNGEAFNFAFDGEEFKNMIDEMNAKVPLYAANQAAYEKVMAVIEQAKVDDIEAVEFIQEYNPEFDIEEMQGLIENAISEAASNAKIALNVANEEGEAFSFPFSTEEIDAMITEMKSQAVKEPNQVAFDKVMAEIDAVKAEYEKAVSDIETEYPEFDITEMKEDIEKAISEAETGAEQALYAANEDGEAFFFPFTTEDIENMIAQMMEEAKTSGVNGVNAADKEIYFDLDGHRINNPKAGMYVKIVDGKATKVVVK